MTSQGDLHNVWTNQRPSFVPRHTLLLLRLTYSLALITLNYMQVKPEKLLTLLHDILPLDGSYLEPHPENIYK